MHGCGCKKISAEMRLLSIPLAYLGLRVWGTIHFFYTLHLFHKCIDANTIKVVKILVILQVGFFFASVCGDECGVQNVFQSYTSHCLYSSPYV